MNNLEQDPDKIALLYSNLVGKKNRMAIFAHYRKLNEDAQFHIRRLYSWEKKDGKLHGALLCGWLNGDIFY